MLDKENNKLIDRIAYIIDNDGYIIDSIVIKTEKEEVNGNIVSISQPNNISFYRRRWNGIEWVEGETEEDRNKREYIEYMNKFEPSYSEIEDAKLEIKTIEIIKEIGVI